MTFGEQQAFDRGKKDTAENEGIAAILGLTALGVMWLSSSPTVHSLLRALVATAFVLTLIGAEIILFIYMLDADWNPETGFTSIDPIVAAVEILPVNLAVIGYGLMIIVTIAAAHIVRKWIGPSADIAIAEAATNRLNSMFMKFVEVRGRQCFVDWLPVEFRHVQAALADDLAPRSDPEPPPNGSGVVLLAGAVIAAMLNPPLTLACAVLVAA